MTYRIIALDLDGTLLTQKKTILPESLQALAQARQAGIKVIIVTGRHHSAIHPFYQALALDTPAICCNGTYLYDYQTGQTAEANPLTPAQAKSVLQRLQQFDIHGLMYADDAMFYQHITGHITRTQVWAENLPESQRPTFRQVDNLLAATDHTRSIWKFATHHTDTAALNDFAHLVEQELGLACEWSWMDQVDIAQSGNSKGRLLQRWVESQGFSMNEVVAFGDNFNDISMLSTAGLGVAMGNSADEVKAHARLVIGHNEQPSIAEVIRSRVLA
ncbi:pyridoxal phosphatase [Dickeya fangzhongdai]|uniref:pyridoxal phosphatase n=1 Tax=Dickeya fangzhongdai TaxID=1778540 RepID=UPI000EB284E4|nr:pyridoxal phosphatase [Dickeya fangzhongdai]AYH47400.1 pyridoxal phosphatase [Dickeya fangzhongdai]